MPEIPADVRVQASRVPAPRRLLKRLRAVQILTSRIRIARCQTNVERDWCGDVFQALTTLIQRGDEVLPPHHDPRDRRRVRKSRPSTPLEEPPSESQFVIVWERVVVSKRCLLCQEQCTDIPPGARFYVRIDGEFAWCCADCAETHAPNLTAHVGVIR